MKIYNYVYLITNNINGKIYVGKHSTNNLNDKYMGSGILLHKAYNKYGIENFTKKILAFADTQEKLNWFECFYIKKYHCRDKSIGYNLTYGGDGMQSSDCIGNLNPFFGKHHTEETKRKISKAMCGKHHTEETKRKIRETMKRKKEDV